MRKSSVFFVFISANVLLICLMFVHAVIRQRTDLSWLRGKAAIVRDMELTDLSLFTDARYTRHLSQADLHSPFQDYPGSFEHFPSGCLIQPPLVLMKRMGRQ